MFVSNQVGLAAHRVVARRTSGPEENNCFSIIAQVVILSEQMHFRFSFLQKHQKSRGGHFEN